MGVFEVIGADTHEEVVLGRDPITGLETIIAVHSTILGPALGGIRFFPYPSREAALDDVLRLSEAMTYKSAAAGLALGGGKAVIIGDPATDKTPAMLRSFGAMVDHLDGRYITAEDVGTDMDDMVEIRNTTQHVAGLPQTLGGSGDPSPATARGVVNAMIAVAARMWGSEDLRGRRIAIQGVGKVGTEVAQRVTKLGAATVIADVDESATAALAAECGSDVVAPREILETDCDILAPCAMGSVFDDRSIRRLRCRAIVGSANNQLADDDAGQRLHQAGVLYAPDFVVNAGGIINIAEGINGYDWRRAAVAIDRIYDNVTDVLDLSATHGIDPQEAAMAVARGRIDAASADRARGRRTG